MPDTTEPEPGRAAAWLKRQAPGWLAPSVTALAVAESIAIVFQAGAIAWIAHRAFITGLPVSSLMPGMWLLLAALVVRTGLVTLRQFLAAGASAQIRTQLRRRLLVSLASAGPAAIESTGALLPVFDEQIEKLDPYYARFVVQRITAAIIPVVVVASVFWRDWLAGLLLALTAPLIPAFMILIGLGAERLAHEQYRRLARLSGWFSDQLFGAATIRLFNAEPAAGARVRSQTDALRQASMRVLRLAFLSSAVLEFFASVAIAAVAIYIGLGLLGAIEFGPARSLTLESGLFALLLAPEFFAPLRALSQGWHDRADAQVAAGAIGTVLAQPRARPEADPGYRPQPPEACRVVLDRLSFGYPGRARLFRNLELEIPAGRRVVLVGPSGGGKSTLISLMAGFLSPDAGEIRIAGHPLARLSDSARAEHVAWLGQRPFLFAGSLADNIGLGRRGAGRDEIEAAARLARVDEFADRMPEGLDSPVGEHGFGLSGGQAQRVALARALLQPRPLILLDEPTANLDPNSEAEVLSALRHALAQRPATVVCATHQAAMMDWAECVIEVDCGRLEVRER